MREGQTGERNELEIKVGKEGERKEEKERDRELEELFPLHLFLTRQ